MLRKANLIQRGGRWYFNRAYPKELWSALGKSPFRLSLQTDSHEVALRRRPDAERQYYAKVDEARAQAKARQPLQLSNVEATTLAAQWFREALAERTAEIEQERGSSFDVDAQLEELDDYEADARQAIAEGDLDIVRGTAENLLRSGGYEVDRRSQAFRALQLVLLRGRRELALIERARLLGDYSAAPSDPVFVSAARPDSRPERTINDLIEAHKTDNVLQRSQSTQAAYEPIWRLLRDVLGSGRPLSSVGRDEGRLLFETVKALPVGVGKKRALRGLKIPEAVKKGRQLGLKTIAPKTINAVYMGLLKTIFSWGVREQWLSSSPLAGLTVNEVVAAEDKRDPFTIEQLQQIFNLPPWQPRNDSPRGKPLHFWGPLIALFHGMRRGEIAQLDVSSIAVVSGHPVILIRDGSGRRLKTANARRMLPVHPELVRMGFLAFVKRQASRGQDKLFDGEAPNSRGQWGDGFSDWFTRIIKSEGLVGARLGMHSYRHNWQDRAREAGLHGTPLGQELAGRSKGGDSSNNYGSGFSTDALAAASASIVYPGLDLSHLYVASENGQ